MAIKRGLPATTKNHINYKISARGRQYLFIYGVCHGIYCVVVGGLQSIGIGRYRVYFKIIFVSHVPNRTQSEVRG